MACQLSYEVMLIGVNYNLTIILVYQFHVLFLIYLYLLKYKIRKTKVVKDRKIDNKRRYHFDAWVLVPLYLYAWFSMISEIVNVDNNKMILLYVLLFTISHKISYCFIIYFKKLIKKVIIFNQNKIFFYSRTKSIILKWLF